MRNNNGCRDGARPNDNRWCGCSTRLDVMKTSISRAADLRPVQWDVLSIGFSKWSNGKWAPISGLIKTPRAHVIDALIFGLLLHNPKDSKW